MISTLDNLRLARKKKLGYGCARRNENVGLACNHSNACLATTATVRKAEEPCACGLCHFPCCGRHAQAVQAGHDIASPEAVMIETTVSHSCAGTQEDMRNRPQQDLSSWHHVLGERVTSACSHLPRVLSPPGMTVVCHAVPASANPSSERRQSREGTDARHDSWQLQHQGVHGAGQTH